MHIKKLVRPFKNFLGDILIYICWHSKNNKTNLLQNDINSFKRDGVVKLDFNFSECVNELREYLLDSKLCERKGCMSIPRLEKGQVINIFCSFDIPAMAKICLDKRLYSILAAYYGSEPYLRNDPQIQRLQFQSKTQFDGNYHFHIDRFNQVSAMILLSEVSMETTHMMYVKGTHKRKFGFLNLRRCNKEKIDKLNENSCSIIHLIGSPGDIYLFDSMGMHRADYKIGTTRDCVFLNFTNGHNLYQWKSHSNENLIPDYAEHIHRRSKSLVFADENKKYNGHKYFHSDFLNKL